jgi:hypothetical protein
MLPKPYLPQKRSTVAIQEDIRKWEDRLRRFTEIAAQSQHPGEKSNSLKKAEEAKVKLAGFRQQLSQSRRR